MQITRIIAGHYRIPLPRVLSDSTHGDIVAFELEVHRLGLERFLETPLVLEDGYAIAPTDPGHGLRFKWSDLQPFEKE